MEGYWVGLTFGLLIYYLIGGSILAFLTNNTTIETLKRA
ncbi:hypothetical protein JOC86_000474 [Bacillus pakistanensis]|uniref:Uncharacterized protein n=1 Tax=Rossellomorea pakistanensis TaxID=992288 RepID=A0ABS2N7V8_9BACI|nr:hypothetical protein [Bacillus pakistanensis]